MASLKSGTAHAGTNTLDDEVAFELVDGADDDDDRRPNGPPV